MHMVKNSDIIWKLFRQEISNTELTLKITVVGKITEKSESRRKDLKIKCFLADENIISRASSNAIKEQTHVMPKSTKTGRLDAKLSVNFEDLVLSNINIGTKERTQPKMRMAANIAPIELVFSKELRDSISAVFYD